MKLQMTKAMAKLYQRRWRAVERAQTEELRRTTVGERFAQLSTLMASRGFLTVSQGNLRQTWDVRGRWKRLRSRIPHG